MRERWWVLISILAWLAFFAAALTMPQLDAGPDVDLGRIGIALQLASVALGVAFLTQLVFAAEGANWPAWVRSLLFICGVGTVLALWQFNLTGSWLMALHAVALAYVAIPIGYWLGDRMEKPSHLIPLCVAMAMADIFSVAQGPSRQIASQINTYQQTVVHKAAEAAQGLPQAEGMAAAARAVHDIKAPLSAYLVAYMPLAGKGATAPVLGIGDFIAMAFLFRAAWVHRMHPGLVFCAALGSALGALGLAQFTHMTLPALPLICAGTLIVLLIAEPRMRKLGRQEIVLSVGVALLFVALIAARMVMGK